MVEASAGEAKKAVGMKMEKAETGKKEKKEIDWKSSFFVSTVLLILLFVLYSFFSGGRIVELLNGIVMITILVLTAAYVSFHPAGYASGAALLVTTLLALFLLKYATLFGVAALLVLISAILMRNYSAQTAQTADTHRTSAPAAPAEAFVADKTGKKTRAAKKAKAKPNKK